MSIFLFLTGHHQLRPVPVGPGNFYHQRGSALGGGLSALGRHPIAQGTQQSGSSNKTRGGHWALFHGAPVHGRPGSTLGLDQLMQICLSPPALPARLRGREWLLLGPGGGLGPAQSAKNFWEIWDSPIFGVPPGGSRARLNGGTLPRGLKETEA